MQTRTSGLHPGKYSWPVTSWGSHGFGVAPQHHEHTSWEGRPLCSTCPERSRIGAKAKMLGIPRCPFHLSMIVSQAPVQRLTQGFVYVLGLRVGGGP